MPMQKCAFKTVITTRAAIASIVLVTNAFVWYFYAVNILKDMASNVTSDPSTLLLMWSIHIVGAIFSALIAGLIIKKRGRQKIFYVSWMLLGVAASFAALAGNTADILGLYALGLFFGTSFGVGMPSCMGYFTEHTSVETRGRLGGIAMLFTGLGMFLLGMVSVENSATNILILAGWRLAGLVAFMLIKPPIESKEAKHVSYRDVITQRPFLLYLVPWLLFSLVNYLSLPVLSDSLDAAVLQLSTTVENILLGVFAIIGGILMDFVGRKIMATAGFVLLGVGYTILGIAPHEISSLIFYTIVDGIALGILFALFVMTVWGDLSDGAPSEKYYALGAIPFFVSMLLESAIGSYLLGVSPYAIFSFTAFFLFLAVLPLMYAPETLPDKIMKDRELKNYIEKAQKEAEKTQKTEDGNTPIENGDDDIEFESAKFEEKMKEAENYY